MGQWKGDEMKSVKDTMRSVKYSNTSFTWQWTNVNVLKYIFQ